MKWRSILNLYNKVMIFFYLLWRTGRALVGSVTSLGSAFGVWYFTRDLTYAVPVAASGVSLSVLANFPELAKALLRQSTTIEDIEELVSDKEQGSTSALARKRLYQGFTFLLIVSTVATFTATSEFLLFQSSSLTSVETLGVLGGLFSLFKRVHGYFGKSLIFTFTLGNQCIKCWFRKPSSGGDGGKRSNALADVSEMIDVVVQG